MRANGSRLPKAPTRKTKPAARLDPEENHGVEDNLLRMTDDPMADIPPPAERFRARVPWGILLMLALVPLGAVIYLIAG